ncbi:exopolygalacturonase-like [Primulina eburnea]|uniref:exopolygalacturonase-like n=1 Tax=Primulina eburnea TaxID=1245227 RepID=UPI003C6BF20C
MDSTGLIIFLIYSCFCGWRANIVHGQSNSFKVTDFGGVADGQTDSSKAFVAAWKKACESEGGGIVVVPLGTYLLKGSTTFEGPCKGQTIFNMEGSTLKAFTEPSLEADSWISFSNINGFKLLGNGTFYGQGLSSWQIKYISGRTFRPSSIKFQSVKNGLIQDIYSVDSKMFHIHFHGSDNILVNNVGISAPRDSPNTDGIHISNADNITIIDAVIATGDDCISMGPGSTNINITRVLCGPGHGISIGSLGKYNDENDVNQITVRNCTLSNTDNGVRIKTWAPSSSHNSVSDVTVSDIQINYSKNPIIIDQYYCPTSHCVYHGESEVAIKRVKFMGIRGVSASKEAVNIRCSKDQPCQDIEFSGLELTWSGSGQGATATCLNADSKFQGTEQVPSHCS